MQNTLSVTNEGHAFYTDSYDAADFELGHQKLYKALRALDALRVNLPYGSWGLECNGETMDLEDLMEEYADFYVKA